jgi:hypothetical protein
VESSLFKGRWMAQFTDAPPTRQVQASSGNCGGG